jgi:tetratricopeptide (TPR) repeat protein
LKESAAIPDRTTDVTLPDNDRAEPDSPAVERPNKLPSPPRLSRLQNAVLVTGAVATVAVWIAGGWAFFDSFRSPPPPKPLTAAVEKSAAAVAEKSPPLVSEKSAALADKPSAAQPPTGSTTTEAGPGNNPPKPPEAQPPSETASPPTPPAVTPPVSTALPQIGQSGGLPQADGNPPVVERKEPVDPAARELISQGWALYHQPYSPVRWQEARDDFERSLQLDPQSSEARIGLASILSAKLADGWSPVLQEDMPRAERLLLEAKDKGDDPNRAAAHFTLGVLRQMQNRLLDARNEFELAISLDPNIGQARLHLGETLLYLGEPQAAISALEQALRLNPDDPDVAVTYWALGTCQLLLGRANQAIDLLQRARAANARSWAPYFYLAAAYGLKGDLERARSALAESQRLKPALRSVARMRAENAWLSNPQYWALQESTINLGLRRAGFSDQ